MQLINVRIREVLQKEVNDLIEDISLLQVRHCFVHQQRCTRCVICQCSDDVSAPSRMLSAV